MVDRNNLNRVKGILSAKQGAEIPKFQNPAGPMLWNGMGDKEIKFHKKKGYASIYSNDGKNWFLDLGLAIPYNGSHDGYVDASATQGVRPPLAPEGLVQSTLTTSLEIPGETKVTPTTAVENAKAANEALETEKQAQVTLAAAALTIKREALPLVPKINLPANKVEVMNPVGIKAISPETPEEPEASSEDLAKLQKWNNVGQAAASALTAVGDAFGAKQAATDSATTKAVDAVYNNAADVVSNFGLVGKTISGAMKMAGAAGNIIQGMGGGTDQQTTMDKWMDSAFFSWNIGMLNGFAGKNSDSFGLDQDTIALVGSSYGGTVDDLTDAANKAGKKYGLFSSKARKKANAAIASAKASLNLMGSIADDASDQRLAVQSMGELAGLAYSIMTSGGYDLKYTYAAKLGGTLDWNPTITVEWEPQIELNWELPEFKEGGNVILVEDLEKVKETKPSFEEWFNSIPEHFRASGYDYKKAYEVFDWEELRKHAENPDKNHLRSVSNVADKEGKYPFLKLGKLEENPELQGEFDWYNSEDGKEHKSKFDIKYIGDRYYYVPKFKLGSKINLEDILAYYKDYDLTKANLIEDSQARTEGNNIYYSTDEDVVHELWHYISQNKPNEVYKDFYHNLDDDKIVSMGGDLQFVKRFNGDPGHFYHPSELESRIKAAKYKTKGQTYTKEFFQNLRSDENKYGYNMRDLLHMYNDDNLVKIFSLKKGGSVGNSDIPEIEETTQKNVIPEGALHKNKHHMEHAEGLTKKGIPVIDEDGEQQAEIEHSEIIFTLEVTKKLEEYYDTFYSEDSTNKEKEQAALEAGKLLVFQILENTDDRTGLIDSCKKGGSLTLKKSTDDLIEEVMEWVPSITIVIDSEEGEKPRNKDKKPEVKSEKEVMKEAIKEVLIELLTK